MDNVGHHARAELIRFATQWGLVRLAQVNEDDRLSDSELLTMDLACSVSYVDWKSVYRNLPETRLTLEQLLQAARKAGHHHDSASADKLWARRLRQDQGVADLFAGASFSAEAKQTMLYQELHGATEGLLMGNESLEVAAFHLVGVTNVVAVVEGCHSPFVLERMPGVRRSMLVEALETLHTKWTSNNADQVSRETALLIAGCVYPFLQTLPSQHTIMDGLQKQKAATTGSGTPSAVERGKSKGGRQFSWVLATHVTRAWDMNVERKIADDQRFRRYKQHKGWQPIYPSWDTLVAYLQDMCNGEPWVTADCMAMSSQDVLALATMVAPYADGTLYNRTQQGKDFVRVVLVTATSQQAEGWSTLDAVQRMLVAHHPDWQTHYSHAWNVDRTTITEMQAYHKAWPQLPLEQLFPAPAEDNTL
jgi:hypothetical protein